MRGLPGVRMNSIDFNLRKRLVAHPLGVNVDSLKDPVKISIPRYVLRGQGKNEHHEFEVNLAALEFPPKNLFGNKDKRVIAERRSHLERYLKNVFKVMLASTTSPLHVDRKDFDLSKHTICEFSPFFKKGVFDYSSHGTG
ncbi:Kinesin-like protein KIF16B [Acipenser ruthenus]|uniref:Kinesin-like protein KIF16B n=1 Tax=Acipenser ruthenus TaxID=7906 RepID=A0A662YV19_ACIRT|nr:Kinesin-like protein KIF16B [Acipenser ruthenus]